MDRLSCTGRALVLAQAGTAVPTPDFLIGSGGWTAAALLAAVLGWLMLRYLPAKDAQAEKLIDTFNKQNMAEREAHDATVRAITEAHLAQTKAERDQCRLDGMKLVDKFGTEVQLQREVSERQHKETLVELEKRHGENLRRHEAVMADLKEQRHHVKGLDQSVVLHQALVEHAIGIKRKPPASDAPGRPAPADPK